MQSTIAARFRRQVAATPEAEAIGGARALTYRELDALSDRLAAALAECSQGVEHESPRTALLLGHDGTAIAAALAALKRGSAVVTLSGSDPASRLSQVRAKLAPLMLLTDDSRLALARAAGFTDAETVVLPGAVSSPAAPAPTPAAGAQSQPDDLAFLICTSGTTGEPKVVMQTHGNVLDNVLRYCNGLGIGAGDRVALLAALSGGQGLATTWTALLNGATLCPFDIAERGLTGFAEWLADNRISVLDTIPSVMRSLRRTPRSGPVTGVRLVRLASEAGLWSDFDAFTEMFDDGAALASVLASSEAGVIAQVILERDTARGDGRLGVGLPAEGIAVELEAPGGGPVAAGEIGELIVYGRHLSPGYWHDDALTSERFEHAGGRRRLRTGDLVRRSPAGELTVIGRADRQVKVSGHRLQLEQVEAAIADHPAVGGGVVQARTGPRGDVRLVAYIVAADDRAVDVPELREWLRARLPWHAIPAEFVELESFPLNPHGKVDHERLAELTPDQAPASEDPGSESEALIAGLWSEAFERDVAAHEGFLDLGGDSLLAAEIAAGVQDLFAVSLDLRTFLSNPTVAVLAAIVDERRQTPADDELPPLRRVERCGPLSFAQARFYEQERRFSSDVRWNVVVPFRLRGPLDVDAFRASVETVVGRHEILRTTFEQLDGRPSAVIRPSLPVQLSVEDVREADDRERRIEQALDAELTRPFELSVGPLLRLRLLRIDDREYRLLRCSHHLIHDAISWEVLFDELGAHYQALVEGRPSPLGDPPPLQYLDYAVWERECVNRAARRVEADADWWERNLADPPPQLKLPFARAEPAPASERAAVEPERSDPTVLWGIDPAQSAALDRIGREAGCTFHMTRMALFAGLLAIQADADDLILGTAFSMRTRAELQRMIGPFANPAMVRLRFAGEPSYRDWLTTVRRAVIDASAHSRLPWEAVMRALGQRGVKLPRASATFVSWQSSLALRFGGIELESLPRRWGAADMFRLGVNRPYERDRCWAEFDPSVHDRAAVVAFTSRLRLLAALVASEPDRSLRDLHSAAVVGS